MYSFCLERSEVYKRAIVNLFAASVLAILTSGTIGKSLEKSQFHKHFDETFKVYFLRDTKTYTCHEKCQEHALCLGVDWTSFNLTRFVCECKSGYTEVYDNGGRETKCIDFNECFTSKIYIQKNR